MVGIYMSGTGNTKHCIEKLIHLLDEKAKTIPMEDDLTRDALKENSFIVIAYPVQYSNIPVMVRNFIRNTSKCWSGKQVLCIATMGASANAHKRQSRFLEKKYTNNAGLNNTCKFIAYTL